MKRHERKEKGKKKKEREETNRRKLSPPDTARPEGPSKEHSPCINRAKEFRSNMNMQMLDAAFLHCNDTIQKQRNTGVGWPHTRPSNRFRVPRKNKRPPARQRWFAPKPRERQRVAQPEVGAPARSPDSLYRRSLPERPSVSVPAPQRPSVSPCHYLLLRMGGPSSTPRSWEITDQPGASRNTQILHTTCTRTEYKYRAGS